jgi:small-conductance mechanosensitive channel
MARYAILVLVVVMVLGQFGVQTASVIAAIGAVGLAIGLAMQGTLQNIAAGIMLLVLRPYRLGEYVEIGGVKGTIEEIGLYGRVNKEPAPTAFVAALADSAVSVTLRYWTSASDFLAAKFDLTRQAKEAFDANGISIPFPQQEVIYREMPTARQ